MKLFLLHTYAFAYRNFIFAKRNVFVVVEMLFWPVVSVLSIGLMGGFLQLDAAALGFVLTGAIAAGILQVTQLDVGYSLMYDLWSKSLKHTFLAPTGLTPAMLGSWLVGIARGTIVFLLLALLARLSFGFGLPGFWATALFLSGVFGTALLAGICVWILFLIYGQRAEISVWALSYLIMLLCGIYYPVDRLPEPFFRLAQAVPLTYFLDGLRAEYGFPRLFPNGWFIGGALNLAYAVLGIWLVRRTVARARRTGLLLQLSE